MSDDRLLQVPDTVQKAWIALRARLEKARVAEAEVKCQWLLAHLLNCSRSTLSLQTREPVSADWMNRMDKMAGRLARHEPLQYVLGQTDFFGRRFDCDSRALIPRPETEQLISSVLSCPILQIRAVPRIADVGTGTGCIAITLALELPHARIFASEADPRTLSLARSNARRLRVSGRIQWIHTDLLKGIETSTLDAVVSNPPYVQTDVWLKLERQIRLHEPRLALDGGPDGLDLIRRLAKEARRTLKPRGRLFLEIGNDQAHKTLRILRREGFCSAIYQRDLQGHPRIVTARRQ